MSTVSMTCTRCGASCTGTVAEALAWDKSHDVHCPAGQGGAQRKPPSEAGLKVLAAIRASMATHSRPPTVSEIGTACGWTGRGTVQAHLDRLVRDGWIRRARGVSRGIALTDPTEDGGDQC